MAKKVLLSCLAVALLVVLPGRAARAAEGKNAEGDVPRVDRPEIMRPEIIQKAAKIMEKVRGGEKLTDEERKLLEEVRRARDAQRLGDQRRRPGLGLNELPPGVAPQPGAEQQKVLKHDERLNVIDAAYYEIAEIHLAKRKYTEAVTALDELVKNSPDKLAVSLTHLNLAELYRRQIGNTEKAIEEYKKVTGEFALDAQKRLAEMFEELDKVDEAVAQFEQIIKAAPDKMQKVVALQQLAEMLARNGREDEAIAAFQRLVKAVSYDEAREISKTLREEAKLRDERDRAEQEQARNQMMRNLQQRFRGGGGRRAIGAAGGDAELRPAEIRPVEPKNKNAPLPEDRLIEIKKKNPLPVERPIEPKPDAE